MRERDKKKAREGEQDRSRLAAQPSSLLSIWRASVYPTYLCIRAPRPPLPTSTVAVRLLRLDPSLRGLFCLPGTCGWCLSSSCRAQGTHIVPPTPAAAAAAAAAAQPANAVAPLPLTNCAAVVYIMRAVQALQPAPLWAGPPLHHVYGADGTAVGRSPPEDWRGGGGGISGGSAVDCTAAAAGRGRGWLCGAGGGCGGVAGR